MALATLSIDLVARLADLQSGLDRAGRLAEEQATRISRAFDGVKTVAATVGASFVAGVAGLGVVGAVRSTVESLHELANAAQIAGAGVEEFQRWAAASETVGISQEKLADQLKDFREKVGEFMQTGGGGMKDFFEQVAPKIGLTADAFRNLSGPEALQLYYDSLEKAGLSQEKMSFYLESMASDTTALIPLLANGGKVLREMGDAAQSAGAVMDKEAVRSAQQLQMTLQVLGMQATGLRNQFVSGLIPSLTDLAGSLADVSVDSRLAAEAGAQFATGLKLVVSAGLGAYSAVNLTGKAIGGLAAIMAAEWGEKGNTAKVVLADLSETAQRAGEVINGVMSAGSGGGSEWGARIKEWAEARSRVLAASAGGGAGAMGSGSKKGKTERDEVSAYIKQLESARDRVLELTEEEKALKLLQGTDTKVSDATRERLLNLAAEIDQTRDLVELKKLEGQARAEIARQAEADEKRLDSLRANTDTGREAARLAELAFLHRQYTDGRIANEKEYQELVDATNEKFKKGTDDATKAAQELGMTFTSAFESAVMGGEKLKNVAAGLLKDLAGIGLRKNATEPMAKYITDLFKGDGKGNTDIAGTLTGQIAKGIKSLTDSDIFKGLGDSLSKTLSSVFEGSSDWLSSLTSGIGSLFSGGGGGIGGFLGSLFSFDGGGSTGNGPRSGGLDGKGGYLALLHPQETVTDHYRGQRVQTSAQAGANIGQINFNLPANADADSFRRSQRQIMLQLQRTLRRAG